MRFVSLILVSFLLAACASEERPHKIPEETVREIATKALNARVKEERFQDAANVWHHYPEFHPSEWKSVVIENGRWRLLLFSGVGAGFTACVTLDRDGRNVRVEGFGFAIE